MNIFYTHYLAKKHNSEKDVRSASNFTVMIDGIPTDETEETIEKYFKEVMKTKVVAVNMSYNIKEFCNMEMKRFEFISDYIK